MIEFCHIAKFYSHDKLDFFFDGPVQIEKTNTINFIGKVNINTSVLDPN